MQNWNTLVKQILTGNTADKTIPLALLQQLGIKNEAQSTEKLFLKTIAVAQRLQSSNFKTISKEDFPPPLLLDNYYIGTKRTQQLATAIAQNQQSIVIEILYLIANQQKSISPSILPQILEYSTKYHLQDLLIPCLGDRGKWLASMNPDWDSCSPVSLDENSYLYGTEDQRIAYLSQLRQVDPTKARQLIAEHWQSEHFDFKTKVLQILKQHLSNEDAAFLESCLDEKRKQVRNTASNLLACLSESPLAQRMKGLSKELVQYDARKGTLIVDLPASCTKAMQRDGIRINFKALKKQGPKANQLAQIISQTPLDFWVGHSHKNPQELFLTVAKTEWFSIFIWAWAKAAHLQKNTAWILAINQFRKDTLYQYNWEEIPLEFLNQGLSQSLYNQIALQYVQHTQDDFLDRNPILTDLLLLEGYQWHEPLALLIIRKIQDAIATGEYSFEWNIKSVLKKAAFVIPPSLYPKLKTGWLPPSGWNSWQKDIDAFLSILHFRATVYALKE